MPGKSLTTELYPSPKENLLSVISQSFVKITIKNASCGEGWGIWCVLLSDVWIPWQMPLTSKWASFSLHPGLSCTSPKIPTSRQFELRSLFLLNLRTLLYDSHSLIQVCPLEPFRISLLSLSYHKFLNPSNNLYRKIFCRAQKDDVQDRWEESHLGSKPALPLPWGSLLTRTGAALWAPDRSPGLQLLVHVVEVT